jgi:glycosyltransferase involved in cell wall biosynthesis
LQETLGIGILEALYCGCIPIVPNRLVYPDLLPVRYHADCLYTTFADLVERLQQAVLHCAELRQYDWRAIAAPYDWSVVAPRYDDALEGVLDGKWETEDRIPAYSHV